MCFVILFLCVVSHEAKGQEDGDFKLLMHLLNKEVTPERFHTQNMGKLVSDKNLNLECFHTILLVTILSGS